MGFFKSTAAQTSTKILGFPAQISAYGLPQKVLYGMTRISGVPVWTGDWQATPVSSGGKSGGKGSGGKGGGTAGQQYTYKTGIIIALCAGPITGIGDVWIDKTRMTAAKAAETYTVPSGQTITANNWTQAALDNGVARSDPYNVTVNDFGAPGSVVLTGTQQIVYKRVGSSPSPGEYVLDPATGVYTFNAQDVGKTITIAYRWHQPNGSITGDPLADIAFTLFLGNLGQAPWGTLTSKFPAQAIGYSETAYVANAAADLSQSGMIPNYGFEVAGFLRFGGGVVDAEPSVIIADILTNPLFGADWPIGELGDTSEFGRYCVSHGIFISPAFDQQRTFADWINDMLLIGNGAPVWSQGKLKLRSYGDVTSVGNGLTFTPNTSPIYDLSYDDFITEGGTLPVTVTRPSVRDSYNQQSVEWLNRANGYEAETLHEQDDWSVTQWGLRPASPLQLHGITLQYVAQQVAIIQVQREVYIRDKPIKFKLPWNYGLLEPMDLVTITEPNIGWVLHPVRILTIVENDRFELEIEAEDFPWGTATPTLNPKQVTSSFPPGYFVDPGVVHAPIFWESLSEQSQTQLYELQIALSGASNWGGATVWVSSDGTNYAAVGSLTGASTMGVLTAALADAVDPDDALTLAVDLSQSGGLLLTYSAAQENAFLPLVVVDQEVMAYRIAHQTGVDAYDITHLRRGAFDSPIQPHASGAPFLFFDDMVFMWKYNITDVGQLRYFKFTSFNKAGQMEQNLANVQPFKYTIRGPRRPYPWNAGDANANSGNPLFKGATFGIQQNYVPQTDGSLLPEFLITGHPTKNKASTKTRPPIINVVSQETANGFIPGGTKLCIGATANGSDGLETFMGPLLVVQVPAGTNTNSITCSVAFQTAGDTGTVYIGVATGDSSPDSAGMSAYVALISSDTTFDILNVALGGQGAPDPDADHYVIQHREVIHGGIYGGVVGAVGATTVELPGSTFAANQLNSRVLSLIAQTDITGKLPRLDVTILSHTADTLTIAQDLRSVLKTGDVIKISAQITNMTDTSLTDTAWANGGAGGGGTGLAPGAEVGNLILAIAGGGKGQTAVISSNTNDTVTTSAVHPFDISTTWMIVAPGWASTRKTDSLAVGRRYSTTFKTSADDTYGRTWMVQVLTGDSSGGNSADEVSPYREIYQPGAGLRTRTITTDDLILITDQVVLVDTTAADVNLIAPLVSTVKHEIMIKKISADANQVLIHAAPGEDFDGAIVANLSSQYDFVRLVARG